MTTRKTTKLTNPEILEIQRHVRKALKPFQGIPAKDFRGIEIRLLAEILTRFKHVGAVPIWMQLCQKGETRGSPIRLGGEKLTEQHSRTQHY